MTPVAYLKHISFALSVLFFMTACRDETERFPASLKPTVSHIVSNEKTIIVPPEVKKTWKSVKIAVIDKTQATENIYEVPIGGVYRVPASNLSITAEVFLPSFIMEGITKTSSSNELNNPGVKVRIVEDGKSLFNGWLFTRFPTTHAVSNPKYGFSLVGAVPFSE